MQIHQFSNGGYVIHKIALRDGGKMSAWYDDEKKLIDIEKFDKNGRKTGSGIYPAMEYAKHIAKYYI